MNLLICASEYYPDGSGIANVAYNVVENLKKLNVKCTVCSPIGPNISLNTMQGYGRLSLLQYWNGVQKYFKKCANDYDAAWLHNPLFIRGNPFIKSLVTIHITSLGVYKMVGEADYPKTRKIYKNISAHLEKYCMKRFDFKTTPFTAISPQVYAELKMLGVPEKNICLIPNGVETNLFKPVNHEAKEKLRSEFGIPQNYQVLLSTGNLTAIKNPIALARIYPLIEEAHKDTCLVIAGQGPLKEKVRKILQNKGVKVVFLGHIDYKKMPDLYNCADVYIMTSFYEGLPLTLLEALSSGLPCIVSNVPSISSIVSEAKAGLVADFNNETEAAQKIIEFLSSNCSLYEENAREYAVKNHDWMGITKKYLTEFDKIIEKNG